MRKLLLASVIASFIPTLAHAEILHGDALKEWVRGVQNQNNNVCCSLADGYFLSVVDWEFRGSQYWVRLEEDGMWHPVPDWAIIKGPNKAGTALVWTQSQTDENGSSPQYTVKCFGAGSAG